MKKRQFFQNAAILTVTSLLLRSIGIFFRIYVSNRIGAEGMGLYQLIISVYVLASSFAVSGLCTAVTRLCADEMACGTSQNVYRILRTAIIASVAVGVLSALVIICGADIIATHMLNDTRAISSLRIMTVSLPFMGVTSCIRGYFTARRKVMSSSVAQISEQLIRIVVIVFILEILRTDTVEGSCFAVLMGDAVSEAFSCVFMIIAYYLDKRHLKDTDCCVSHSRFLSKILHIAAPITGGRYLSSGLRTAENLIVPNALEAFSSSRETALSQFGKLKGMAMPLIFFPSSFLTAFTTLLIPELSEANILSKKRQLTATVEKAFRFTVLASFPIAGTFFILAYPLGELLYHDREVGMILRILAPLCPVMYLESVVVGILKGLDQQTHSLIYSVIDSLSRIVLIIGVVPCFGIQGFLGVMVFSNLLTCSLNVARLLKTVPMPFNIIAWLFKPLLATVTSVGVTYTLTTLEWISTENPLSYCIGSGVLTVLIYCVLLPILGCLNQSDFAIVISKKDRR